MGYWTEERIDTLDTLLQSGYSLDEIAQVLEVPRASVEATFHRILLQSAVAFGEHQAVAHLADRYQRSEDDIRALLGASNTVAGVCYRRIQPWQPFACDSWVVMVVGTLLGVGLMTAMFAA